MYWTDGHPMKNIDRRGSILHTELPTENKYNVTQTQTKTPLFYYYRTDLLCKSNTTKIKINVKLLTLLCTIGYKKHMRVCRE